MHINNLVISNRILILSFESLTDMNTALMRFSEWRESPQFKGQEVSQTQIIDSLIMSGKGDYRENIAGHNIWGATISEMRAANVKFNDHEQAILNIYDKHLITEKPCMIIGCVRYDKEVILHELAHAAYMLFTPYREKCQEILGRLPAIDRILVNAILEKDGYNKDVWDDEAQAYLLGSPDIMVDELKMKQSGEFRKRWKKTSEELRDAFVYYMGQFVPLNILE